MKAAIVLAAIAVLVVLSGCASKPVAGDIPIPAPCLGPAPQPPTYMFGVGPYPEEVMAAEILKADLADAKGYIVELKAQMAGCR